MENIFLVLKVLCFRSKIRKSKNMLDIAFKGYQKYFSHKVGLDV